MAKSAGNTGTSKILLVEDDRSIVKSLCEFLRTEGFRVESASGQSEALALADRAVETGDPFDLALLDISLQEGNGYAVCSALKAQYRTPVIFLTASGDEYSTVTGFDLGADDYISKPFPPRVLVSRIRNVLRLTQNAGGEMVLGNVTVDTVKGTASKGGKDLFLSALEYRLLLVFLNHRGAVLTRAQLLDAIWDAAGEFVNDNTLTVYIKRLREKIEDDPGNPVLIRTIRGMGYQLDP